MIIPKWSFLNVINDPGHTQAGMKGHSDHLIILIIFLQWMGTLQNVNSIDQNALLLYQNALLLYF